MVIYLDQYDPPKPFWMMSIADLVKHNKKCIRLDKRSNFKWRIRQKRRYKNTRNKRNRKTRKRNKITRKRR